jgi:anti-sigma-K factor RskA
MADKQPLSDADRADLTAYLDGELAADARRRIEQRLAADAMLRTEADSLKQAWEMLDYLPRPAPGADFATRTLERVSAVGGPAVTRTAVSATAVEVPRSRRRRVAAASWTAAAVLALALGFAATPGRRPITASEMNPDADVLMVREPTVVENLLLYLAVENLDYLLALDQSDLFADDATGR